MSSAAQEAKLNNKVWFTKISLAGIIAVKSRCLLNAVIFLKTASFSMFPLTICSNTFCEFEATNILSSIVVKITCSLMMTF
jgi:hypothetical protein